MSGSVGPCCNIMQTGIPTVQLNGSRFLQSASRTPYVNVQIEHNHHGPARCVRKHMILDMIGSSRTHPHCDLFSDVFDAQ